MTRKINYFLLLILISLLFMSGCKKEEAKDSGKPIIYASFYPISDLTKKVAGDTADVRTFMPVEKEPHLWEPTPKDLKELAKADMLVVNGANMERWLDQVRDNLPDLDVLVLSDSVELITYKGAAAIGDFQYMAMQDAKKNTTYKFDFGHTHEDIMRVCFLDNSENLPKEKLIEKGKDAMEGKGEVIAQHSKIKVEDGKVYALEMGHEKGEISYEFPKSGKWVFISDRISENLLPYDLVDKSGEKLPLDVMLEGSTSGLDKITYDPHSWMSVVNAKSYLNALNEKLSKKYPKYERLYYKNKVKAIDKLSDLEYEYKEKFKDVKNREFVVTHYAYEYLARDFDLVQFPLQGLVSTESPSLKTIKKAIDFCNYHELKTVFYESGHEKKGAGTLASEINGQAQGLTSMEYLTPDIKSGKVDYTQIMRDNIDKIYNSLK